MIPPAAGPREAGGHAERAGGEVRALGGVDGPADDPAGPGVKDDAANTPSPRGWGAVMSVTHSWFGPSRRKSRRTRSVTVTSRRVRLPCARAGRPASPARRISRLTVLCPTVTPWP